MLVLSGLPALLLDALLALLPLTASTRSIGEGVVTPAPVFAGRRLIRRRPTHDHRLLAQSLLR